MLRRRAKTLTSGFARRLWNQAGCRAAPPLDAMSTRSSPSRTYASGTRRSAPLLAPLTSITSTGAPRPRLTHPRVAGTRCLSILFATLRKNQEPARDARIRTIVFSTIRGVRLRAAT